MNYGYQTLYFVHGFCGARLGVLQQRKCIHSPDQINRRSDVVFFSESTILIVTTRQYARGCESGMVRENVRKDAFIEMLLGMRSYRCDEFSLIGGQTVSITEKSRSCQRHALEQRGSATDGNGEHTRTSTVDFSRLYVPTSENERISGYEKYEEANTITDLSAFSSRYNGGSFLST